MKRVLVISSSPRRGGNSDLLCDEFVRGVQDAGHSAEKVFLRDKKIGYCTGCGACYTKKVCVQKDDMAEMLDKMIDADVIVLATPVYFYTMCGQMKTFIDRCCARYEEMNGKDFYYIATAADANSQAIDRVVTEFQGFLDCLNDPREKSVVRGTGVWNVGEVEGKPVMREAYEMGMRV